MQTLITPQNYQINGYTLWFWIFKEHLCNICQVVMGNQVLMLILKGLSSFQVMFMLPLQ